MAYLVGCRYRAPTPYVYVLSDRPYLPMEGLGAARYMHMGRLE